MDKKYTSEPFKATVTPASGDIGRDPYFFLSFSIGLVEDVVISEFISICDSFTNKKLFLTDNRGGLIKDEWQNLTKINNDNI